MKLLFLLVLGLITGGAALADCPEALTFDQTVNCIIDEASSENFDTILSDESAHPESVGFQHQNVENTTNTTTPTSTSDQVKFVNIN